MTISKKKWIKIGEWFAFSGLPSATVASAVDEKVVKPIFISKKYVLAYFFLSPCASTPKLNLKSFAWKHSVGSFDARRGSHSFTQWSGKFFFYTFKQIPIRIYCLPINWTQHHRYDAHASGCRLIPTDNAATQCEWKLRESERSKQTIEPNSLLVTDQT